MATEALNIRTSGLEPCLCHLLATWLQVSLSAGSHFLNLPNKRLCHSLLSTFKQIYAISALKRKKVIFWKNQSLIQYHTKAHIRCLIVHDIVWCLMQGWFSEPFGLSWMMWIKSHLAKEAASLDSTCHSATKEKSAGSSLFNTWDCHAFRGWLERNGN